MSQVYNNLRIPLSETEKCNIAACIECIIGRYSYSHSSTSTRTHVIIKYLYSHWGWVGLWGFLWWAPSAKRKDHHGVSSGWSSVWHHSNTGLSGTQYEQIANYTWGLAILADSFLFSVNNILAGLWLNCISSFLYWNYSLSSGWHIIAGSGFVSVLGFS